MRWLLLSLSCGIACALVGCGKPPRPPRAPMSGLVASAEVKVSAETNATPPSLGAPSWSLDDWPGWRGPNNDGVALGEPVPTNWSETENVLWKVRLEGRGHSSPVVIGDRIYLEIADEREQTQSVLAIDRRRGKRLWQTPVFTGQLETIIHAENSHGSSTLATDGERLFATFLNNQRIWCSILDFDGNELQRTDVGGFRSKFGYSSSPMVYQHLVLIAADHEEGGFIAGLRRDTGELVWRRKRPAFSSYASPRVVKLGDKDQLILPGCRKVSAYDPLTGDALWATDGTAEAAVGTAVTLGELVFASGGYPEADTVALRPDGQVVWRHREKSYVPSLIAIGDHVYAIQDDGVARCWNAATGKERWKHRVGGKFRSSPVCSGGNIFVTDMSGKSTVFRASPEKFELVAENQLGDEGFASPAISQGELFLRTATASRGNRTETLYCIGHRTTRR